MYVPRNNPRGSRCKPKTNNHPIPQANAIAQHVPTRKRMSFKIGHVVEEIPLWNRSMAGSTQWIIIQATAIADKGSKARTQPDSPRPVLPSNHALMSPEKSHLSTIGPTHWAIAPPQAAAKRLNHTR